MVQISRVFISYSFFLQAHPGHLRCWQAQRDGFPKRLLEGAPPDYVMLFEYGWYSLLER